jgi:hypothetical protein
MCSGVPLLVQGAILAACAAKKLDERKNLARSEEDLVKAGRWLSDADRCTLDRDVQSFLRRAATAAASASPSPIDAFDYQNHLIVHWLNGNSVPVFRSEVFCQLRIHETIRWSEQGAHWLIEVFRPVCLPRSTDPLSLLSRSSPARTLRAPRRSSSCCANCRPATLHLWRLGCAPCGRCSRAIRFAYSNRRRCALMHCPCVCMCAGGLLLREARRLRPAQRHCVLRAPDHEQVPQHVGLAACLPSHAGSCGFALFASATGGFQSHSG